MSEILQDTSEPALTSAIEANLFETFAAFRAWPRCELYDGPDLLWSLTDIPLPLFNTVFRAHLSPDQVDVAILAAMGRARHKGVPTRWVTGPATRPADLGAYLEAHGFTFDGDAPGMAMKLSTLPGELPMPPGLVLERVTNLETVTRWSAVCTAGFGLPDFINGPMLELYSSLGFDTDPPYINYLGWLDGMPVATSTVFLGAGVAGIYNVATLPAARGKGIGRAMTHWPLLEARRMGYRAAILQASPMGVNIYRRLGFQEYCRIADYVWSPTAGEEAPQ